MGGAVALLRVSLGRVRGSPSGRRVVGSQRDLLGCASEGGGGGKQVEEREGVVGMDGGKGLLEERGVVMAGEGEVVEEVEEVEEEVVAVRIAVYYPECHYCGLAAVAELA
jgi:hypothetical protein